MMMKKKKKKENNIYLSRVPVQLGASRWRVYSRMRDGDVSDVPLKIMNNKYTHLRTRACIYVYNCVSWDSPFIMDLFVWTRHVRASRKK